MSRKSIAGVFRAFAGRMASWLLVATPLLVAESSAAEPAPNKTAATPAAAKDCPRWLGSKAGLGDELLSPWTPVRVSGGTVTVWGRNYTFGTLPLPASVTAREKELLASPIALTGIAGGREIAWTADTIRTDQCTPTVCVLAVRSDSEQLKCEGKTRIEYDGMVRADLRLLPKADKVTVKRLDLEIPLRREHARYLHTWPGQWGSSGNSGALSAAGYRGPLKPFVWLGDEWRGLAWFVESDRGFAAAPDADVLDIRPSGGTVVMRVHVISKPTTIDRPLEYTFGFQATPVKPLEPDAWDYRIVHMGSYGLEQQLDQLASRGVRTICFHEHWTDIQNYTSTTHEKDLNSLVAACHEHGIQLLLYFGYLMSDIAPEWSKYHEQCLVLPRTGDYQRQPKQTAYMVCYQSVWQDFLADGIDKMMERFGIDGVYLDGTSEPWGCANTRHGCGFKKPDGSIAATYPFFATRDMMRRIYTIVKRHNPKGQVNVHQSTCMTIPTLSFATSYWDGEQLQGLARRSNVFEVLPLDAFRAEFMGHNWGVPAELLWYSGGPFRRGEAEAMAFLHDIPVRPSGMDDLATLSRLWTAREEFGCRQAAWLPYWENEKYVRSSPAGVKVSLHNRPGQGLLATIANTSPQTCQAEVALDLKALRQPAAVVAHNIVTGKRFALASGRMSIPLGPLEYAILRLDP